MYIEFSRVGVYSLILPYLTLPYLSITSVLPRNYRGITTE